jgi:hypothetical protein
MASGTGLRDESRSGPGPGIGFAMAAMLGLGVIGCVLTVLKLDPANLQQEYDFNTTYLPSMKVFAEKGLVAAADYPAAPTPAYYMLQGAVLALFQDVSAVRFVSVVLGLLTVAAIWTFPTSRGRRLAAIAAVLISPYFRGQVWYANGDVLALLLMVLALRIAVHENARGWPGLLLLASSLVYVRQNFLFVPAYVFVRGVFGGRWPWLMSALLGGLAAVPMLWLVYLWGGIAPPQFQNHLSVSNIPSVIVVGFTIAALYLSPILLVRAMQPRRLWDDILGLPVWVHALILLSAIGAQAFVAGYGEIYGGGLVFIASRKAEALLGLPITVLMTPAFIGSAYLMALVVRSDPWTNVVILLATLSMSISVLIYQRYFDPLIPLLLILWAKSEEIDWLEKRGLAWTLALPSLLIAVTASLTR